MKMLSNLPRDLAEEVLTRVPAKSMCAVRSVCKKWNTLSKNQSLKHLSKAKEAEAEAEGGFLVVMSMENQVSLMSVNLHGIHNNVEPSINHQGKLVSLTDPGQVEICKVYHCDGLLLCITGPLQTSFLVWNPYSGQTRCLEPITYDPDESFYSYAIGYDNSKSYHSHKVLRFFPTSLQHVRYELYYLNSKSSRDITIPITILTDWIIMGYANGVSVKGNTYWFAQRHYRFHIQGTVTPDFLICFDFTRERFGPRLSLPFQSYVEDTVTLSSVRDEQLAVLFQRWDTFHMEIWISATIEPEMASWSKLFLAVDMNFQFPVDGGGFFVDEEKKVAVLFERDDEKMIRVAAYVIGEDGYFKKVDIGEASNMYSNPPVLCSYVPSLAQTKRPARGSKKPKYYQ